MSHDRWAAKERSGACRWHTDPVASTGPNPRRQVERIMWSSDFPHLDSSWPESRRFLDKHLGEVPPDEARLIVAGNCARLYHLA